MDLSLCEIIKRPRITSKAQQLNKKGCLVLEVHQHANKPLVAQAVEELFGVKVERVRIMNRKGKKRRITGRRTTTTSASRKLALVTLVEGHSLDLFDHQGQLCRLPQL